MDLEVSHKSMGKLLELHRDSIDYEGRGAVAPSVRSLKDHCILSDDGPVHCIESRYVSFL